MHASYRVSTMKPQIVQRFKSLMADAGRHASFDAIPARHTPDGCSR
jgi:hypothetical protein